MSNHEDAIFVRNFSIVLVGLCVIGLLAFVLAKIVNRSFQETQNRDDVVAARLAPVGKVNVGSEAITVAVPQPEGKMAAADAGAPAEAAPVSGDPGKAVYDSLCFTCHAQGIAGAPKYADMAAWEARLAKGRDALIANAIKGYTGPAGVMPARGGNPALSDEEVAASVDYMLAAVGGNGGAPAPAAAPEPAPEPEPVAAADAGRGKEVYDAACFVCHAPGAAGAPKFGDVAAWSARIEQGMETLYKHSISGYMGKAGMMPPKGGRPDFSDDDVKAAVDYMVANAK